MRQFIAVIFLMLSSTAFSQLEISTAKREEASLNAKDTTWNIDYAEDVTTFFQFNAELTELTQFSIAEKVNYCILKWDFNEQEQKYSMKIVNDAGEEFDLVVDGANRELTLFYWKKKKYFMIRYEIKASNFKK